MTYTIQFENAINNKAYTPSTRLLAADVANNGYANVGEFFMNMPQADLDKFLKLIEDEENEAYDEVVLLAGLLSVAEGLDVNFDDDGVSDMMKKCTQLNMLFVCESLSRKGLVKLHHENISFGEDMLDKILIERLV
jgi:hypothetical protein